MIQRSRILTRGVCRVLEREAFWLKPRTFSPVPSKLPSAIVLRRLSSFSPRHTGKATSKRWASTQTGSAEANMAPHAQDQVQSHSLEDPESFWKHQADQLYWHKKPSQTVTHTTKKLRNGVSHSHWTWFPDGEISTSYNCVDRHVQNGHGDSTAIIWDSPVTGQKEKYTYKQLLEEVESLAGVLREGGVKKGDVVLVYSKSSPPDALPGEMLILPSADDSGSAVCHAGHLAPRGNTRSRLRRLCPGIVSSTYRGLETTRDHDGILWHRRF